MVKIINYKKKKNNLYEITLSNGKINIYDDVILKYNLLLKKNINDKELDLIIKDNNNYSCYYKAISLLNIKMRTEKELIKKLNSFESDAINYSINRLKQEGYLNNDLYIKSYINDQINLKVIGPNKIIIDLKRLGFKENEINKYLLNIDSNIWLEKIDKIIKKKIETNHKYSGNLLKQKIIAYLISIGYSSNDINMILDNYSFEDNDEIYIKEYNKIKNKLSKKYQGEELEIRIKNELWKKGYK